MGPARAQTVRPWVAVAAISALAAVGSAGTCADMPTSVLGKSAYQQAIKLVKNPNECIGVDAGFIFYDIFTFLHENFGTCSDDSKTTKAACVGTTGAARCTYDSALDQSNCTNQPANWITNSANNTWIPDPLLSAENGGCVEHEKLKIVVYEANKTPCKSTVTQAGLEKVLGAVASLSAGRSVPKGGGCRCEDGAGNETTMADCTGGTWECETDNMLKEIGHGLCTLLDASGHEGYEVMTATGDDGFIAKLTDHADTTTQISVPKFEAFIKKPPFNAAWCFLYILGILYLFCGIAIVCDDFFTASLEQLSIEFKLSEDVAGATFMAAGSSAPELFTSLASVMFPDECSNRSSVGIGTIVGSAIFNILIIIGATAMLTTAPLQLSWRPLVRDTCWYAFSIAILVGFVMGDQSDDPITKKKSGYVTWWEGLIMTCCYFLYILFMKFNDQIMGVDPDRDNTVKDEPVTERIRKNSVVPEEGKDKEEAGETDAAITKGGGEDGKPAGDDDEEDGEVDCLGVPKPDDCGGAVFTYFSYFWYLAFMITIPNCEPIEEGEEPSNWCHKPTWYAVSFLNSIIWIGVICWGMVECAILLGEMLGISATVMGLTVLSAGTSVPDAISSIVVAQRGMGDMAVSNALGSNVFDILLGLGFPYFLAAMSQDADPLDAKTEGAIKMCTEDIGVYIFCLALVLVMVIGTFTAFKFQLHPQLGYILCSLYGFFAAFAILRDTGVIDTGGSCDAGH